MQIEVLKRGGLCMVILREVQGSKVLAKKLRKDSVVPWKGS